MKFRMSVTAAAATLLLGTAVPASAQLGGLSLPGLSKSSSGAKVDVDAYLKNALTAEVLLRNSLEQLVASLGSKEDIARIEALKQQAAGITDSKEKEAKTQEITKSLAAAASTVDFEKAANEKVKAMDAQQKKTLGAASFNFVLAMLKDKELVGQSQSVIDGIGSNPANLGKLGAVKDTAASLKNQLELGSALAVKVPKLFATVGVKNPPTKASDAPVSVAD
ncbi:hypothetical protein GJV26_18830 [Massilia dura]|uniref:DUF4142 domain-containing protein n=2 Tax=Pseudoduganella dura TaxID=321982 RepID=A0A6I3XG38_9BURK|nr:hypothetical protein [Pseudoduganella dura]GGY13858.1 hypothetical protein GCM10007386_50080 [Pseudoduganella dura]